MKKILTILSIALLATSTVSSCGKDDSNEFKSDYKWQQSESLNEWQKNLLEAEELPTDINQLTSSQKKAIQRIYEMITYLNEKYGEEFIYKGYVEPLSTQNEELYAYSLSDKKKRTVTVKTDSDGNFIDDYQSSSVSDYCEELIDNWICKYLDTDNYRYFSTIYDCNINMSEIKDENFQWKYGASNIIFIKMDEYSFDEIEKFAVEYAKFLYSHQIDGTHRINVMRNWPDYEVDHNNIYEWYDEQEYIGYYSFHFEPFNHDHIYTDSGRFEVNNRGRAERYDYKESDYLIDDYFTKY